MNSVSPFEFSQKDGWRGSARKTPGIPPFAVGAILAIFVLSAIAPAAPVLPMLSVMLLAVAGVELTLARFVKSAGASRWELTATFVLAWAFAAALSEPLHIVESFGLTMPQ